jgi:putative nucleotidyltransferase with HDIG domain
MASKCPISNDPVRRDCLINSQISERLDHIDNLPTLPRMFMLLLNVIEADRSSAADLARIICADQSLTARLLKYANSPLLRGRERIENVQQAVIRLGFEELKRISLTALVYEGLFRQSQGVYFNRAQFWKHSALVGYATAGLVERLKIDSFSAVAFVAGLLHDIGIVILDRFFPEDFSCLIKFIDGRQELLEQVEEAGNNPSHASIGACLLYKWSLPETVWRAVCGHHSCRDGGDPCTSLASVIYLADFIVRRLKFPFYISEPVPDIGHEIRSVLAALQGKQVRGRELSLGGFVRWFASSIPLHLERLRELVG